MHNQVNTIKLGCISVLALFLISGCRGMSFNVSPSALGSAVVGTAVGSAVAVSPPLPSRDLKVIGGLGTSALGLIFVGIGADYLYDPYRHCEDAIDRNSCIENTRKDAVVPILLGAAILSVGMYWLVEGYNEEPEKKPDTLSIQLVPEVNNNRISTKPAVGYNIHF